MTISQAYAAYDADVLYANAAAPKTRRNYRSSLNSFIKAINSDLPVQLITTLTIVGWKQRMMQEGIQPSSAASNLSRFRNVIRFCKKHGFNVIDYQDIDRPKIKRKNPTWLEVEEVRQFLSVIEPKRDKALFACLFSSGARISELLQLNRDSMSESGEAEIIGKGDKPGRLSFDSSALEALSLYLDSRKDKLRPLFVSGQNRRITVSRVEQLCHIYADLAGIDKNVTPHVFRHSFATDLKNNGMDLYDLSKQLRHESVNSTMIYVHTDSKKAENYRAYHTEIRL